MVDSNVEQAPSVEDHLAGTAAFMREHGIVAVYSTGQVDGEMLESISFSDDRRELADVRFIGGKLVEESIEEHARRLTVGGIVVKVIRPLQRAARVIYGEGSDLLDERLDVIPGLAD